MYTFLTRPFTCRAIARPFARLAIASFYVYGLLNIFMLSCNATDDLRMDEFHKLKQRLIERGLHAAWNLFNTGENDIED